MLRLLLLLLCSTLSLSASVITGKVVWVDDGDTLSVLPEGRAKNERIHIRLWGIDAPEKGQNHWEESKKALHSMVYNKTVKVNIISEEKFGRKVGQVYLGGLDVNQEMVKRGHAWWYEYFAPDANNLKLAQAEARGNLLGLWKESDPKAPWNYRLEESNDKKDKNDSAEDQSPLKYWITTSSKRVHNKSCKYYNNSKGYYSDEPSSGPDCKLCGGAHQGSHNQSSSPQEKSKK
jgi:endonuclease YncB( thermonuclease family)